MKKLKLSIQNIKSAEMLSRDQLKKVLGGNGSGTSCWDDSDCGGGMFCKEWECRYQGNCGNGPACGDGTHCISVWVNHPIGGEVEGSFVDMCG